MKHFFHRFEAALKSPANKHLNGVPDRLQSITRYYSAMACPQLTVTARPQYLPEQSAPSMGVFGFAYTITIVNTGDITAQLLSRSWRINDANGMTEKVTGPGVVGHQPTLAPGERFEYTSGCRLRTPTGTMHGQYHCMAEDGTAFNADIPMFVLDALSSLGGRRTLH